MEVLLVHILEAHKQFVTKEVSPGGNREWLFTVVYANPHPTMREELWAELEQRASNYNRPWLLVRDLNETRSLDERDHGGRNGEALRQI